MRRRIAAFALLLALLLALPGGAAAAGKKASIRFPAKVGLMLEEATVTLKPKLSRIKRSQLSWSSSDEEVLQVADGVLRAVKAGKAVVTASGGGAKARCGVVVLPAAVAVQVGEKLSLPCGGVEKYKIKKKSIATVSKKGVITGKKAGSTSLQVKYGRQKLVLAVTVTEPVPEPESPAGSAAAQLDCAAEVSQIVLVEHTGGSKAVLSLHEKQDGVWKQLYECAAYVGRNGIDKTREGDKRTPTGTYNLTTPFGIKADPGANMPYTKVTKYHYWCGASNSGYYNQLVDERETGRKHTSADEYLISYKGVYNYCMFIDYNTAGEAHKGSCIFLHCTGRNKYTSGCVAVPESTMVKIICWAWAGVKIVIREKPAAD